MRYINTAKIFVILSVLILFAKSTYSGFWIKPDALCIIIAVFLTCVGLIQKELTPQWKKLLPIGAAVSAGIIGTVIGSITSHVLGYNLPWHTLIVEYRVLIGCVLIFTEIIILGQNDLLFLKRVAYAFLASLAIVITPYIPIHSFPVLQGLIRFSGFIAPDFYPTFMLFPTVLLFYLLIQKENSRYWILKKVAIFILFALSIGLIIWSGTRSGWLGLSVALVLFSVIASRESRVALLRFFILFLICACAGISGYFMLPHTAKLDIKERITYITTPPAYTTTMPQRENNIRTIPIIDAISHHQDRLSLWVQGLHYIYKNPLGYGLGYSQIINIDNDHSGVHSFPLELILTGGILLLGCIGYLFYTCTRDFVIYLIKKKEVDLETVLYVSLIGFLVCSLFLATFLIRWFWIELALLITWQMQRKHERVSTISE